MSCVGNRALSKVGFCFVKTCTKRAQRLEVSLSIPCQVLRKGMGLPAARLHAHVYPARALLAWLGRGAATLHVVIPAYGLSGTCSAVHSLKLRWHAAGRKPDFPLLSLASAFLPFPFEPQTLGTGIPSALALIVTTTLVGKGAGARGGT